MPANWGWTSKIVAVGMDVCVADQKAQWISWSIAGASVGRRAWE